ncbi:MAG: hypothetical protein WD851_05955 [Pirellulales bacterium]
MRIQLLAGSFEQHDLACFAPQSSPQAQPSVQSQPGQVQSLQFSPSQLHSSQGQSGPQQQTAAALDSEPANDGREAATAITIIATTASNKAGTPKRWTIRDMEILLNLMR